MDSKVFQKIPKILLKIQKQSKRFQNNPKAFEQFQRTCDERIFCTQRAQKTSKLLWGSGKLDPHSMPLHW